MSWERMPETHLVTLTPDHKEAAVIKLWLDERKVDPSGISKLQVRRTKSFDAMWYTVFSVEPNYRLEPDLSTLPGGNRKLDDKVRHVGAFSTGHDNSSATVIDLSLAALVDAEII